MRTSAHLAGGRGEPSPSAGLKRAVQHTGVFTMQRHLIALGLLLSAGAAHAQNDTLGVGVILAEPTGLSAKLWLSEAEAIDAAVAWSFSDYSSFQFHMDYLFHRFDVFRDVDRTVGRPSLYFGLGGRLKLGEDRGRGREPDDEDDKLGVRVPAGVTYVFAQAPFDVFAEIVPILDLAPDTEVDLNAAVGGRFYFGRRHQLTHSAR